MSDRNDAAAVVAALYQARGAQDLHAVRELLHADVVWREHEGQAGYAGVHRGRDSVISDMLGSAMAATGGSFRVEAQQVIGHGPNLAVALVRWSANRDHSHAEGREVAVYRTEAGKVVEASFQLENPQATDAFFAGQ